jgi:hypothetical protein
VRVGFFHGRRDLTIAATFHPHCGLPNLNGKNIELTATDITLVTSCIHGAIAGGETIDRCDPEVPTDTWSLLAGSLERGIRRPQLVTHSGSSWAILCESLALRIY